MKRIVLFDLDETIGYFQNIGNTYNYIKQTNPTDKNKVRIIHELLKKDNHAFRPGIFDIFTTLKRYKKSNPNIIVALFTNNQGPKYWYNAIVSYINSLYKYKLFDHVIGPYTIGNTIIEEMRTSNNKSIHDIAKILRTNITTDKYIFFDDQYHSNMIHPNVEYVYIDKYIPRRKITVEYIKDTIEMKQKMIRFLGEKSISGGKKKRKSRKKRKLRSNKKKTIRRK